MKARMILLMAVVASAFAGSAAQTAGAASQTIQPTTKASHRQRAAGELRAKWLLHNPGLPAVDPVRRTREGAIESAQRSTASDFLCSSSGRERPPAAGEMTEDAGVGR
jgi:hypothetical protein